MPERLRASGGGRHAGESESATLRDHPVPLKDPDARNINVGAVSGKERGNVARGARNYPHIRSK